MWFLPSIYTDEPLLKRLRGQVIVLSENILFNTPNILLLFVPLMHMIVHSYELVLY